MIDPAVRDDLQARGHDARFSEGPIDECQAIRIDYAGGVRMVADAVGQSYADFVAAAEHREQLFRAWRDFFTRYDVLLCPITPTVAFPHDVARLDMAAQFERSIIVNGKAAPYMDNLMWPGLVTVANLPATAIPTRRLVDGLPAGVQIVGPYLEDRTTLKFAQLLERELGGFMPPPSL